MPRTLRTRMRRAVMAALFLCLLALTGRQISSAQPPQVVRFAVIGDSGSGDKYQYEIGRQMAAWHSRLPFGLVLMLGDNIYGGWLGRGGGNRKYFGKQFDQPYAELLGRGVVFRAALGNHDTRTRNAQDLIDARDRFHIDGPLGYYRFAVGEWRPPPSGAAHVGGAHGPAPLVEFFVLNTTRMAEDQQDPEQLAWLEKALAASRARWRIVYGHHPIHSTGRRHGSEVSLRRDLEPLLLGSGANPQATAGGAPPRAHVYLAGHDHFYQRFHAQNGVAHFVSGSGGKLRRGNARPSPQVAAVEDRKRAFMLWEATPEELRFRAINEDGEAFDCGVVKPGGVVTTFGCHDWFTAAGTHLPDLVEGFPRALAVGNY
ncbi:MAG: metallophosphoesterase [Acidobacteria bacterium]|nr:metallophosphoesterase [Acidobacteriota bacterium]